MAIPDFQSLMLPLLTYLAGDTERTNQETLDALAASSNLSDDERTQLLPSGRPTVFRNRVAWAKSYLVRAGLIETSRRGIYRITDLGRQVLAGQPERIDLKFLGSGFGLPAKQSTETQVAASPDSMTPEDHIELGYQQIRGALAADLLRSIKECAPDFFERLVVDLLLAMGYGGSRQDAGQAVGRGGDGGIDGIIKEDRLGLDAIYIQAKRWEGVVGRPEIQKFAGALQGQRARKGIFLTTSSYTKEAREFAASIDSKIILIDGEALASLMMDFGVGVTDVASYLVKRVDSDYFGQE